jgi:hypothetical protein
VIAAIILAVILLGLIIYDFIAGKKSSSSPSSPPGMVTMVRKYSGSKTTPEGQTLQIVITINSDGQTGSMMISGAGITATMMLKSTGNDMWSIVFNGVQTPPQKFEFTNNSVIIRDPNNSGDSITLDLVN